MKGLVLIPLGLLYVIPAVMVAAPLYLIVALLTPQLSAWPGDRSDWMVLLAMAGVWWVLNILSAPARVGLVK